MFVVFPLLAALVAALCLPAWLYARPRQGASWLLLFLFVPATIVWVVLSAAGIGAQSLSNLIEVFILMLLSVVACYLQVFVLDRSMPEPRRTSVWVASALALVALLLRLTMPVLPE
jgi:hypothetical protein